MAKLNPKDILKNGIVTATQADHQNRTPKSWGIDIDAPELPEGSKAPVYSPIAGKVDHIGPTTNAVFIIDKDNNEHRLLHHDSVTVKGGDQVKKGDQIGKIGKKGADKDHVHYQIKNAEGDFLDPQQFEYP